MDEDFIALTPEEVHLLKTWASAWKQSDGADATFRIVFRNHDLALEKIIPNERAIEFIENLRKEHASAERRKQVAEEFLHSLRDKFKCFNSEYWGDFPKGMIEFVADYVRVD